MKHHALVRVKKRRPKRADGQEFTPSGIGRRRAASRRMATLLPVPGSPVSSAKAHREPRRFLRLVDQGASSLVTRHATTPAKSRVARARCTASGSPTTSVARVGDSSKRAASSE
jgi:hypothetical protein